MKGGYLAVLCGGLMLASCSSVPVTPDFTPTPDTLIVTVAALQTQNARLATQVAGLPVTPDNKPTATSQVMQTPVPSPRPTETLAPTATPIPTRVVIHPPLPTSTPFAQILDFAIVPGNARPDETVSVSWRTANASRVVLRELGLPGLYGSMTYQELEVAPSGTLAWNIINRGWAQSVLRLQTFYDADPAEWQEVTLNLQCAYTFFFSQQWREDCPSGAATPSAAADEVFETGRMIWLETNHMIYELRQGGQLMAYQDTWTDDQPTSDPAIEPPAGRYQPVRGFGKVWRTMPYVQGWLGWAVAPEQGYQTQVQPSSVGCRTIPESGFYLQTSDGHILHICEGDKLPGYWEDVTP